MKVAVYTNHSSKNIALARLTAMNRWEYSAHNRYDLLTHRMEWEECQIGGLRALANHLKTYDAILMVGSDVVFTNFAIRVEDLIEHNDCVVMSREIDGRERLNNDVSIWTHRDESFQLIEQIIRHKDYWYANCTGSLWQGYLRDRILEADPLVLRALRIVAPRVLNATDQSGEWHWQPGDFVCHCLGGLMESKIERVRPYLEKSCTQSPCQSP